MYKVLLLQSPGLFAANVYSVPTRCRLTIVSDLKSPATSCITINGSEKFTVSHLSLHHCQSNRDVWGESEMNTDENNSGSDI